MSRLKRVSLLVLIAVLPGALVAAMLWLVVRQYYRRGGTTK